MAKDSYNIKASEAYEITYNSTFMIYQIYKAINDTAKDNRVNLTWELVDVPDVIYESIISNLRSNGYGVYVTKFDAGVDSPVMNIIRNHYNVDLFITWDPWCVAKLKEK